MLRFVLLSHLACIVWSSTATGYLHDSNLALQDIESDAIDNGRYDQEVDLYGQEEIDRNAQKVMSFCLTS